VKIASETLRLQFAKGKGNGNQGKTIGARNGLQALRRNNAVLQRFYNLSFVRPRRKPHLPALYVRKRGFEENGLNYQRGYRAFGSRIMAPSGALCGKRIPVFTQCAPIGFRSAFTFR